MLRRFAILMVLVSAACGGEGALNPTNPSPPANRTPQTKTVTVTSFAFSPTTGVFQGPVKASWTIGSALTGFSPNDPLGFWICLSVSVGVEAICSGGVNEARDWTSPQVLSIQGSYPGKTFHHADLYVVDTLPARGNIVPPSFYYHRHLDVSLTPTP